MGKEFVQNPDKGARMASKESRERYICRGLTFKSGGQDFPLLVKEIRWNDGSSGYSLEIQINSSETLVIDSGSLANGLEEAESLIPLASQAREILDIHR